MRLRRITVVQFQQFRSAVHVSELEAGINLFIGPNESGKSTLVRAIRAAFFERHRSTSLTDLQPWGDSSAAPEVRLEFDWQGSRWTLHKRFLQRKRCDLQVGDKHYARDVADDRLAELLGYQLPGRGASKAEHWGIPGLLWVEQGAGQEIREPVGHAGEHLQSVLSESLSGALREMTSSSGDALIARVETERGKLLTSTGRPTGELRDVQHSCEVLGQELKQLNERIAEYRDQVDRLSELRRLQLDIDAARPWASQREKAQAAQQKLETVQALQAQHNQAQRELESCQRHQQLYRQQLQDFESQAQQLEERWRDVGLAQKQLERHQADNEAVERRLRVARQAYADAEQRFSAARQQAYRHARQSECDRALREARRLDETLDKARELRASLLQLAERYQACAVDDGSLEKLQHLEQELALLRSQQQVLATRLDYILESDRQLIVDGKVLDGRGEALLLKDTEIRIGGIGVLTIKPGGSNVGELLRRQQRLQADRASLLEQMGVADLAEARQRASAADELTQQIRLECTRLEGLAPAGVDELENQHYQAVRRHEQLSAELAQLAVIDEGAGLPSEEQAEAARVRASEQLKAAEHAQAGHRQAVSLAEQAVATADAEWRRLRDERDAPDRKRRRQQASEALTDLRSDERGCQNTLIELEKRIEAANPDLLVQDVERFRKAAESLESAAREREGEISRLQASLETLGAQGLEEQRNDKRQMLERRQRRRDELARRAAALDLLLSLLKEKRQAVTRQLQAPLQRHLNHYLKLLYPGAELSVDEDLKPQTLIRGETGRQEHLDLAALSFGAREQMGLISRLAYADLLREAGRPTLIILDDALVHSDRDRREQMKRILYDAGTRHQVLLFTCHPEHWQDLGVVPREMRSLKTVNPGS